MTARNTGEGGTNAANVTTGTSGGASGDAFSNVTAGTSHTLTWSNTNAMHGSLGYLFTKGGTPAVSQLVLNDGAGAASTITIRCYLFMTALPANDTCTLGMQIRSGGAAQLYRAQVGNTGVLKLFNSGGTLVGSAGTVTLSTSTYYRLETQASGLGTASTSLGLQVFAGDSTTPLDSVSATGVTTSATADRCYFGNLGAGAVSTYAMDDFTVQSGSSTPLGPDVTTLYPNLIVSSYGAMRAATR